MSVNVCKGGINHRQVPKIVRWAGFLHEGQFEIDVCKIFLLATEIRNRQRICGQPCVRKCELDGLTGNSEIEPRQLARAGAAIQQYSKAVDDRDAKRGIAP